MSELASVKMLLEQVLNHEKDRKTRDAMTDATVEMAAALSDLVEQLETRGTASVKAIEKLAEVMKAQKQERPVVNVAAPDVTVSVDRTPVNVNVPKIEPVVHVHERDAPGEWEFTPTYSADGRIKSLRAKRIT